MGVVISLDNQSVFVGACAFKPTDFRAVATLRNAARRCAAGPVFASLKSIFEIHLLAVLPLVDIGIGGEAAAPDFILSGGGNAGGDRHEHYVIVDGVDAFIYHYVNADKTVLFHIGEGKLISLSSLHGRNLSRFGKTLPVKGAAETPVERRFESRGDEEPILSAVARAIYQLAGRIVAAQTHGAAVTVPEILGKRSVKTDIGYDTAYFCSHGHSRVPVGADGERAAALVALLLPGSSRRVLFGRLSGKYVDSVGIGGEIDIRRHLGVFVMSYHTREISLVNAHVSVCQEFVRAHRGFGHFSCESQGQGTGALLELILAGHHSECRHTCNHQNTFLHNLASSYLTTTSTMSMLFLHPSLSVTFIVKVWVPGKASSGVWAFERSNAMLVCPLSSDP